MGFDLNNIQRDKKSDHRNGSRPNISSLDSLLKREIHLFGKPFSNRRKEGFYTEVSVLLKAGITLKQSLLLIRDNQKKKELQALMEGLVGRIINGKSFSEAASGSKEFTEYEVHSIRIGEETGTLGKVTAELGSFFARKNEQQRMLVSALTYPVIIMITALLVVVFMLRFVVPMFQDIFRQNNVELPTITKFILGLSSTFNKHGGKALLLLCLILIIGNYVSKKTWFKRGRDKLLLTTPFVGPFIKNVYLAQFTQAVGLLTASQVPMLNSIQLVKRMVPFYPLQDALDVVEGKILKGNPLRQSMENTPMFDNKMVSLVKVAEETNQTAFIFQRLNQQYALEVQQKSKLLSTALEPFIIVFVGVLVGIILIAMYLPMFKLSSALG